MLSKWMKSAAMLAVLVAATGTLATSGVARTLAAPTLTGFAPPQGLNGEKVTIYGHNLADAQVQFGGTAVEPRYVTVDSAGTHVTFFVPADAQRGLNVIAVTTLEGTVTAKTRFTVKSVTNVVSSKPHLKSFAPMRGRVGTKVTLKGSYLGGATWVKVGGVKAVYTVPSANRIVVTVPGKALSGKISIKTSMGVATSPLRFTFIPAA